MTQHPLVHRSRRALALAALVAATLASLMMSGPARAAAAAAEQLAR